MSTERLLCSRLCVTLRCITFFTSQQPCIIPISQTRRTRLREVKPHAQAHTVTEMDLLSWLPPNPVLMLWYWQKCLNCLGVGVT